MLLGTRISIYKFNKLSFSQTFFALKSQPTTLCLFHFFIVLFDFDIKSQKRNIFLEVWKIAGSSSLQFFNERFISEMVWYCRYINRRCHKFSLHYWKTSQVYILCIMWSNIFKTHWMSEDCGAWASYVRKMNTCIRASFVL